MNALSPQILGKVYSVLSDQEQRAVYDEQGTVDEDSDVLSQDRDWETYWRLLFKKVEKDSGDFRDDSFLLFTQQMFIECL